MTDAADRGSHRYELLAAAVAARCDPDPDPVQVGRVIHGLERCARLEGWRLAGELAAQHGVAEWRRAAERMAEAVVAGAGPHREEARRFVDRLLNPSAT
jgi:hypothetical protein